MLYSLLGWVKKSLDACYYFIAPPVCYICHTFMIQQSILCGACDIQLLPITPKLIQVTKKYTMNVHAMCRYDGPIKQMIIAKHHSDHVMIKGLADLMWQKTVLKYLAIDCLIPIPLHWSRALKRGFNQAEVLARQLAKHKGVVVYDMVTRIKKTEYQAQLEKSQRHENVKDAFTIKQGFDIAGKHIMLVDDLCTTGSTAVAVAKILAKYNPSSISLLVACRAL